MKYICRVGAAGFYLAVASTTALAGVSPEQAARLGGGDLTPTGAERAGNDAGTIPAWDGGLTTAPTAFGGAEGRYANPYPNDEPKFVITADNLDQHRDHLTDGQIALLQRWPDTYKMPVYETRRSYADPEWVYKAVADNAINGELIENGEGIAAQRVAFRFRSSRKPVILARLRCGITSFATGAETSNTPARRSSPNQATTIA